MIEKLEDFPWYQGLYGEVVTSDCYGLKNITCQPDVIFDIGGNVGVFSRYARQLFPDAKIIAVEPDPVNCGLFRQFTSDPNTLLLEAAIGKGIAWKHGGSNNGMFVYTSAGIGYPQEEMEQQQSEEDITGAMKPTTVQTLLPSYLLDTYAKEGQKVLMKIDCEGGENAIWSDQESLDKMKSVDFLVIELHYYANHGGQLYTDMQIETFKALIGFKDTHNFTLTNVLFTAIKK